MSKVLATVNGVKITLQDDGYVVFTAGMTIDGDGANGQVSGIGCYAPANSGLKTWDYLANAGEPGNYYGIVTKNGVPIIQSSTDPAPGYYVSPTRYMIKGKSQYDPFAYLDSETVPYSVTNPKIISGVGPIVMGCRATVTDLKTGKVVESIVGDSGPSGRAGEASMAMAKAMGVPWSPKNGGTSEKRFLYTFHPGVPAVVNGVTYPLQPS